MIRDWRNLQGKTIKLRAVKRQGQWIGPHVTARGCSDASARPLANVEERR